MVLLQPDSCPWEKAVVILNQGWPVISEQRHAGRCSGHGTSQRVWASAGRRHPLLVYVPTTESRDGKESVWTLRSSVSPIMQYGANLGVAPWEPFLGPCVFPLGCLSLLPFLLCTEFSIIKDSIWFYFWLPHQAFYQTQRNAMSGYSWWWCWSWFPG